MNQKEFSKTTLIIIIFAILIAVVVFVFLIKPQGRNSQMMSFANISACNNWMNLDKIGYLGCIPKSSKTRLIIKNNLDKDIRINFENLSTGSKLDTFFTHQEKTIELKHQDKEVLIRVSDIDNQIISDKQELNLILWKLE